MTTEETQYECSECGTQVAEDDKVCPKCGASLEETIYVEGTSTPDPYMQSIADLLGQHYYPNKGPKGGIVIGAKDGYLIVIGMRSFNSLNVIIRFKWVQTGSVKETAEFVQQIKSAVIFTPELLGEPGIKELPGEYPEELTIVGADNIRWEWKVSRFMKPSPNAIALLASSLFNAVNKVAPPFDGFCETCKTKVANEIVLGNGVPGYYCLSCQETVKRVRFESLST